VAEYRRFVASATAKNPTDPFIERDGYRACIDTAEAELRQRGGALAAHGASVSWKLLRV
jgi:hypothetical protein